MRLRACLLAIAVVVPVRAFAQTPPPADATPPPPAPAPTVVVTPAPAATVVVMPPAAPAPAPAAPPAAMPKFVFGGLVDTYYMYNFTPAPNTNSVNFFGPALPGAMGPVAAGVGRAFDTNVNSMTLALAKLTMNASLDVVSLQLDMGYGSVGNIINAANDGLGVTSTSGSTQVPGAFLIEQAFGEISLPGNLTLDFGKFTTTAGAEVIEANKNWLYSRSLLFNAIPLLHTGVRANLKINDMVTVQGSVVNGWNNDPDLNAWKTIGLSASITASPMVSIIATTYFGKEAAELLPATTTPGDMRFLLDLVGAFTLSPAFGLNLNVDYIKAFDDIASDYQLGGALMGRYVLSDHLNVAARGEYLATHYAAAPGLGTTETISQGEVTAMLGIDVGKNFELRPEIRADFAGKVAGNTLLEGGTKSDAVTGTLAALTWF
jgi:Putative beta-barrel porin-2, OmpL-like. bbp2